MVLLPGVELLRLAVRFCDERMKGNPRETFQGLLGDVMRGALDYGEVASVRYAREAVERNMERGDR